MPKTCTYTWNGTAGKAEWSFAEGTFLLLPEGGAPLPFAAREFSGIAGDGYTLELRVPGGLLSLGRMGQDGPTFLEALQRTWPLWRADALRLAGTGEPKRFAGRISSETGAKAAAALLYEDVLLLAREGEDLAPVFLPTLRSVDDDPEAFAIALQRRGGPPVVLSKLAGATQEFLGGLKAARGALTRESLQVLSERLPALSAMQKAALAGLWPPGLMVSLEELEHACPGFTEAFRSGWLAAALRRKEGETLLAGASTTEAFLGFARPKGGLPPAGEEDVAAEASSANGAAGSPKPEAPAAEEDPLLLWLLVRRGASWLLESLTEPNHATYRFEGGDEILGLATCLLCSPQFSREALYQRIETLTGDKAGLAIAARDLGFLKELRARFKERIIHTGLESWKAKALR